jgi:O-antigen ligase
LLGVNSLGIVFSMTRSLWLACFVLLVAHVTTRRPRLWALPVIPLLAFLVAPAPLQERFTDSMDRNYYSNPERIQMWRVGWKMTRQHPLAGVGAGNIERLYPEFVPRGEPLPSYHGHLYNNAVQLGAEFGLPVLGAAVLFTVMLARDLTRGLPELDYRIGLKGLAGFLMIGMTDDTPWDSFFSHSPPSPSSCIQAPRSLLSPWSKNSISLKTRNNWQAGFGGATWALRGDSSVM